MATNNKDKLPRLTETLVEKYAHVRSINHLGHCPLPNPEVVAGIIEDLKEVLFPGYQRREGLHAGNVIYHVGDLVDSLHDRLARQIAQSLRHEGSDCDQSGADIDYEARGEEIAIAFLDHLPELHEQLSLDVKAAYAGDPAALNLDEVILSYPGVEAVTVYRLAHLLHQHTVPYIPRMMTEWAHRKTGIDIHPGAKIGQRFFIDHGTGVVIGESCNIGNDVKIYQGVTLGALSFPQDSEGELIRGCKRHPTIEDGVVIYANATVLGGKTVIGRDSVIGSNVWLTQSVAPQTTVVLEKPKLRMKDQVAELDPVLNYQI
ncbi:MAG: serine acetyltransferase [Pirellulales bacterium]|nr:serine acetyltransferase [Pirellulales bacterium]